MSTLRVALALGFETHDGHRLPGASPLDVRSADRGGVRQDVKPTPTSRLPSPLNPIPTSSARPNRGTNERISVARSAAVAFEDAAGAPSIGEIHDGDVVFAQRGPFLGRGGLPVIASLRQLNTVLASGKLNGRSAVGTLTADAGTSPPGGHRRSGEVDNDHGTRWKNACAFLSRWVPEGVAFSASRADQQRNLQPELAQVAVSGPTPLRNSFAGMDVQIVDDMACAGDAVYLGLVAERTRQQDCFCYRYKMFTRQQLLSGAILSPGDAPTKGKENDFCSMVQTWKLGTLLDPAAARAKGKARMATLLVDVKEVPIELLARHLDAPALGLNAWWVFDTSSVTKEEQKAARNKCIVLMEQTLDLASRRVDVARASDALIALRPSLEAGSIPPSDSHWCIPEVGELAHALFKKHDVAGAGVSMLDVAIELHDAKICGWNFVLALSETKPEFLQLFLKCRFVMEAALSLRGIEEGAFFELTGLGRGREDE